MRLSTAVAMGKTRKGGPSPAHAISLLCGIVIGSLWSASLVDPLAILVQQKQDQETEIRTRWNDRSSGWSLIHVFYGTRDHLPFVTGAQSDSLKCNTWFSQARQDELIFNLLSGKRNGYFVDIAANDAVQLSNTYALETHFDWKGLCIEASPKYWPSLSYRKCGVVGAVVANDREEVHFRFSNGAWGGIVGKDFDNKVEEEMEPRLTVTLREVLERFEAPQVIDYLSLDVEGAEDLVLQDSVLDQYHFHLITLERPSAQLKTRLAGKGYKFLKKLTKFGETLFVKESMERYLNISALEIDTWGFQTKKLESCQETRV